MIMLLVFTALDRDCPCRLALGTLCTTLSGQIEAG